MKELTDEELSKITLAAVTVLVPIIVRYKITDTNMVTALTEAFQEGVKFSVKEIKT